MYFFKLIKTDNTEISIGHHDSFKSAMYRAKRLQCIQGKTKRVSGWTSHKEQGYTYISSKGEFSLIAEAIY